MSAEVIEALLAASRAIVALATMSLAEVDAELTLPQFRTLVLLVTLGPQRVVDLADGLGVQPSTATRMCERLVRKGIVVRDTHPDDRRAAWITLTPAGKDLVGQVMRHRRQQIARLMRTAEVKEPEAFAAGLRAFVAASGEPPDPEWWRQWRRAVTSAEIPARRADSKG